MKQTEIELIPAAAAMCPNSTAQSIPSTCLLGSVILSSVSFCSSLGQFLLSASLVAWTWFPKLSLSKCHSEFICKNNNRDSHPCSWTNADTSEWRAANFLTSAPPLTLPFWFSSFCWQQTIKHCFRKREVLFMRGLLFKQRQTPRQPSQHYSLAFNVACQGATFPS